MSYSRNPFLVRSEEIRHVARELVLNSDCDTALAISAEACKVLPVCSDTRFIGTWIMGAVYAVGRIQGIREERLRRKRLAVS